MRLNRGPLGPLLMAALVGLSLAGFAAPALADGPGSQTNGRPLRAVPVPRAPARAPSAALGYAALEDYAFAVAADLTALDQAAGAIADQRRAALARIAELEALEAVEKTPNVTRDRLERVGSKLATAPTAPSALSEPERESVAATRALLSDAQTKLVALRADVVALDGSAADVAAAGAGRAARPSALWASPAQGRISQRFGPTRVALEPARTYDGVAYAHFHDGIDIAATWGSPVQAAAPGKVVYAGGMADGAWIILIAHTDGFVTLYAHLDPGSISVAAGDYVSGGQQIGVVGSTGISTGPHLHFSVWHDGGLIDPMRMFR